MRKPSAGWFLIPVVGLTLAGCPKHETETTSGPPGGAPPGSAAAPAGPAGVPPPGTAASPSGHPTPPAPGSTGNEVMVRKVKNALITNKVDTSKVGVTVNGTVITLSGSVPTATQKTEAAAAAKQVEGVKSVVDKLKVGGAP